MQLAGFALAWGALSPCTAPSAAPRLDHVIIAVRDLDSAAAKFRALGYRLKPGRLHQNGLLNQHIKFRDGTEIELMTVAGPATDRMAKEYADLIAAGDGGAYLALRVASPDSANAIAGRLGLSPRGSSAGSWHFLSFPPSSPESVVFFVSGGSPARDPDSIFVHPDGATGLADVWVEAGPSLVPLLSGLGGRLCPDSVQVAGRRAPRIALANGSVVVLQRDGTGPPRVIGVALRRPDGPPTVAVLPNFWIVAGIEWR